MPILHDSPDSKIESYYSVYFFKPIEIEDFPNFLELMLDNRTSILSRKIGLYVHDMMPSIIEYSVLSSPVFEIMYNNL